MVALCRLQRTWTPVRSDQSMQAPAISACLSRNGKPMIKKLLASLAIVLVASAPVVAQDSRPGSPITSGTANTVPKYITPGSVGNSLAADNGTKFSYTGTGGIRSEEHTSELQSLAYLVCRLLL